MNKRFFLAKSLKHVWRRWINPLASLIRVCGLASCVLAFAIHVFYQRWIRCVYRRIDFPAMEDVMGRFPKWKQYAGALTLTIEEQYECWKEMGFPPYFKIRVFHFMMVCSTQDPNVSSTLPRADIYQTYKPFFGERAILLQDGKTVPAQRGLLNRGFYPTILVDSGVHFVRVARRLRSALLARNPNSTKSCELLPILAKATLESVAISGFNMDLADPAHEADVSSLKQMMHAPGSRFMMIPFLGPIGLRCWSASDLRRVRQLVDRTVETRQAKDTHLKNDLLNSILDAGDRLFKDKDVAREWIRDQIKTMYVGGTDTTSLTIHWALMLLARYPKYQDQMCQEIHGVDRILELVCNGEDDSLNDPQTVSTLCKNLVFTECFLKETLRLYGPSGVGPLRRPVSSEVFGVFVPEECLPYVNVMHNSAMAHRDERVFPRAIEFLPERWMHSTKEMDEQFTAFGYGSRACIGRRFAMMEMKLFLWVLLQGNVKVVAEDPKVEFPSQVYAGMVYGPSHEYPVRFKYV